MGNICLFWAHELVALCVVGCVSCPTIINHTYVVIIVSLSSAESIATSNFTIRFTSIASFYFYLYFYS